jgi:predicted O-linked N-acetylglucosamine transferase (SPINDLY family)
MEPPDGDDHYTERLVRLPGLSIHYTPPAPVPPLTRADFGLPDDAILYLSCQLLLKHLPQHDGVFVEIARRVPGARIVMLGHPRSATITAAFRNRLAGAFAAAGLVLDDHVVLLPPQSGERFQALLGVVDLFLDGVGWSGGVTSLEAIMAGLPLAAIPGPVMRSRHTAAILTAMGLPELVALTVSGFVDRMVRLGLDGAERARVRALIAERRPRLIADPVPVRALETFLEQAAAAASPEGSRLSSGRS